MLKTGLVLILVTLAVTGVMALADADPGIALSVWSIGMFAGFGCLLVPAVKWLWTR